MKKQFVCHGLLAVFLFTAALGVHGSAAVILLDEFENRSDLTGTTPDVGSCTWTERSNNSLPLVNGDLVVDPSAYPPPTSTTIGLAVRCDMDMPIPGAATGMMLQQIVEISDRGADGTPSGMGADIQKGEIRLQAGNNEYYLPGIANPLAGGEQGTYFVGTYAPGSAQGFGTVDTGKAIIPVGSGASALFRARIRSISQNLGVEYVIDISEDGGATYDRLGRFVRLSYFETTGTDSNAPGMFTRFQYIARGTGRGDSEFNSDFVRIESVPKEVLTGDMDLDGDVDFDDIDDFVLALNNAALYTSTFGVPASDYGDTDGDGDQDFDDIPGFVGILTGGSSTAGRIPEPSSLLLVASGGVLLFAALGRHRRRSD